MKKLLLVVFGIGIVLTSVILVWNKKIDTIPLSNAVVAVPVVKESVSDQTDTIEKVPTERFSAQVDRVKVIFEQWDYTRFRLQTNDLVREGEMNSERGFGDDPDATLYVLNWHKTEGERIYYVRLTAEPQYLYVVDSYRNLIKSGRLMLEL